MLLLEYLVFPLIIAGAVRIMEDKVTFVKRLVSKRIRFGFTVHEIGYY